MLVNTMMTDARISMGFIGFLLILIKASTWCHSHHKPLTNTSLSLSTFPIKVSYYYPVVVVVMAIVTRLVTDKAVVIFSKSSCCICHSIKTLICSFGANPTVYELDEHPDGQLIERELKSLGCKLCAPTVFIGQHLIGGANEIMSLHLKGKLVPMLIKERAIWL
ncbi:hypothetical protein L1887_21232 [Cichorium endivia]|nr:hypothetical protein L1887_21232 [Cichorium endivia]